MNSKIGHLDHRLLYCLVLFLFLFLFTGTGCSTIVAERISSQQSFSYDWFITDEQLFERGFQKSRYCSVQYGLCLSYLYGGPQRDDKFRFQMQVNGDSIDLALTRKDIQHRYRGTVVLLHGFAISKEYMAMSASYFRFLGFDVVVPDMLGHGESGGGIGFGTRDSVLLDELLRHLDHLTQPLLLFGNSMGAVAATHLAMARTEVDGLILQAPMLPFDLAAYNYIRYDSPLLATLVTEKSIRKGALKALQQVPVSVEQTDIRPLLSRLDRPVLLLASPSDTVSPHDYFLHLENEQVTLANVPGRNHYSMVVIDQADSNHILPWLGMHFRESALP